MSALTPTIVAAAQYNYLWPQYSLPWNNFFGRIRPNPFYLSNTLRNLAVREVQSPLTYDSNANATYVNGLTTVPTWSNFQRRTSKPIVESATKVFIGRYFDTSIQLNGLEYQYNMTGTHVPIPMQEWTAAGMLVLSINLANQSLTENLPVYVDTAVCDPCKGIVQTSSLNRCQVGSSQNFFTTLTGVVTLNGVAVPLVNPLPYTDACHTCPTYFEGGSNSVYAILGNKLYLGVRIPAPTAATHILSMDYVLATRVVEVTSSSTGLRPSLLESALPIFPNINP